MDFFPFQSFKISATISLKKPLAGFVFLTLFSLKTYGTSPILDQEFHALRTELAQVYEKIARLEKRVRAEQFVPNDRAPSFSSTASTASLTSTEQTQDEEDSLFHSPNSQDDAQDPPESQDTENIRNKTREQRTLSIDKLITENEPFSTMPVPPGWVAGTVPASALVSASAVGQKPSRNETMMPGISVQQAKWLLEKREMLRARHMLAELATDQGSEEYPFAMYWLGILDMHENRLDISFSLFLKVYTHCKTDANFKIQQLCVAALLRMSQIRLRQNKITQAKTLFEHCQKRSKSLTVPLPRHILYGIREMRARMRTEMKKLKKAGKTIWDQAPPPAAKRSALIPGPKESYTPIAQPLSNVRPEESVPLLLNNAATGSERDPEKGHPSDSTEDNAY
jgi:hypothetical protein